jgi:hypothetical protein
MSFAIRRALFRVSARYSMTLARNWRRAVDSQRCKASDNAAGDVLRAEWQVARAAFDAPHERPRPWQQHEISRVSGILEQPQHATDRQGEA